MSGFRNRFKAILNYKKNKPMIASIKVKEVDGKLKRIGDKI